MARKPKRPRDVVSNAVHVMRIATGEITDRRNSAAEKAPQIEARPSVPDLATVDDDERVLLITRKLKEARASRRKKSFQGRPSTKGS